MFPSFDSSLLLCTSESLTRQETRRSSVAKDHWKAMNAQRGAWKHNEDCDQAWTTSRRSTSPTAHPWPQRHRYDSTITLVCNDDDRQAGPMRARKDFKPSTKILTSLRQAQGRQKNSFIPKNERMRQRPFDEALRAELEWMNQHWKTLLVATFFRFASSSQQWWQQVVKGVNARDSCKSNVVATLQDSCAFVDSFTDFAYRH